MSKNAFVGKLSKKEQEQDYFLDILSHIPNANVVRLTQSFYESFLKQKQKEAGLKLLEASENNALLDMNALIPNVNFCSHKNMQEWQDYYDTLPKMPKYKTGINFLDSVFDGGGGIESAQLVLTSGDPEAGKTTLGLQMLEFMAKTNKVCFLALNSPYTQKRKSHHH